MEQNPTPTDNQTAAISNFVGLLYRNCPQVYVTPTILAINATVFIFLLFQGAGLSGQNLAVYIEYGANLGALTKDDQWWRLLTAIFMHYGVVHLALNMWVLWDVGRLTERLYHHKNYAWIFLFTGLFASLSSLYWNQDQVASVGASGAVFGIFGALIAYLVRQRRTLPAQLLKQLLRSALLFTGLSLFLGFTIPAIDNAAHIGGLLSGFILGLLLAKPITHLHPALLPAIIAHSGSIAILVIAVILAPAPYYNYSAQMQAQTIISNFIHEEKRLLDEWRLLAAEIQAGKEATNATFRQQLNNMLTDWSRLQEKTHLPGNVQKNTASRILLLHEYAGYRLENIRYFIRTIESGDDSTTEKIKENNKNIKRVLELLNKSANL